MEVVVWFGQVYVLYYKITIIPSCEINHGLILGALVLVQSACVMLWVEHLLFTAAPVHVVRCLTLI